jgi:hypothetical protein
MVENYLPITNIINLDFPFHTFYSYDKMKYIVNTTYEIYLVNINDKSIKAIPTELNTYDCVGAFSTNNKYVVLYSNFVIEVWDISKIQLIISFPLSFDININPISNFTRDEFNKSDVTDLIVIDDLIYCSVDYMNNDEHDTFIGDGMEVYNMFTGQLVANDTTMHLSQMKLIPSGDTFNILGYIKLFMIILNPKLEIIKTINPDSFGICLFEERGHTKVTINIQENKNVMFQVLDHNITKLINAKFKINSNTLMNFSSSIIKYSLDYKYIFMSINLAKSNVSKYYSRFIIFDKKFNRSLMYFDVDCPCWDFNIIDNYKLIITSNNGIYSLDTPLTSFYYAKNCAFDNLPEELWDNVFTQFASIYN